MKLYCDLIKLTRGVSRDLPCYAASPEKLFSFLVKLYCVSVVFSLIDYLCWIFRKDHMSLIDSNMQNYVGLKN